MTRHEKTEMPRFGRKQKAARKRWEQAHRHRRDRRFTPPLDVRPVLRRMREDIATAEYGITGMENVRAWFKRMGYVTQTGDVSLATLRKWRMYRGLPLTNRPGARFRWGSPWTTNFLLAAWCLSRGPELAPAWCPLHKAARAGDGRELPSPTHTAG